MKEEMINKRAVDAHLIAIYGTWSWDYWDEVNHPDPTMRVSDEGPSSFVAVCAGSWLERPSEKELEWVLARVDGSLDGMGHAVRIGFSVLNSDKLIALKDEGRCDWSGKGVPPGDEFEIISENADAAGLQFFL